MTINTIAEADREMKRLGLKLGDLFTETRLLRERTNYIVGGAAAGALQYGGSILTSHNIIGNKHFGTGANFDLVGFTASNILGIITPSADPLTTSKVLKTDATGLLILDELKITDVLYGPQNKVYSFMDFDQGGAIAISSIANILLTLNADATGIGTLFKIDHITGGGPVDLLTISSTVNILHVESRLYNASDLILYSDVGITERGRWDGATGNITINDLTMTASKSANLFLGSPSGGAGVPAFRAIATGDLPAHVLATTAGLGAQHTTSGLAAGQVLRATGATTAAFQALQATDLAVHALVGAQHSAAGLTIGHVVRATGATTFAWQQLQHTDVGGVGGDQHHAQVHVLATTAGLGADHTTSGLTVGQVLRASGATTAAFAQLQHSDLGGVTADQHHARSHTMSSSADHTATAWRLFYSSDTGVVTEFALGASGLFLKTNGAAAAPTWDTPTIATHVLATTAGLGAQHTTSGLTAGQVLRATSATTAAFASLVAGDLPAHALVGAQHNASGLTIGNVVRATGATTFAWAQLQHTDLGGVGADQHHAQSHILANTSGLGVDHTTSGLTVGQVLRATGATTAAFQALQATDLAVHSITGAQHTGTGAAFDVIGFTAVNVLGILTPSSAPAATEALLKTNTSGGLTLVNLAATGKVFGPNSSTNTYVDFDDDTVLADSVTLASQASLFFIIDSNSSGIDAKFSVRNNGVTPVLGTELFAIDESGIITMTALATIDSMDPSVHIADANAHHTRSHAVASASDHTATAWRLFYAAAAGAVTELALGSSGLALLSGGASSAPTWGAPTPAAHSIIGAQHTGVGAALDVVGFTATNVLGVLTPSFNPGAASALLKSSTSGQLILTALGIGGAPEANSHIHVQSTGAVKLILDADTDNVTETDHPSLEFRQDGGAVVGQLGYFSGGNDLTVKSNYTTGDLDLISNRDVYVLIDANNDGTTGKFAIGKDASSPGAATELFALAENGKTTFLAPEVAHGMTDHAATNVYALLEKDQGGAVGGFSIVGFTESTIGLSLSGFAIVEDITETTSSTGAITAIGRLKSGAGAGAMTAGANVFAIKNYNTALLLLKGNGNLIVGPGGGNIGVNIDPLARLHTYNAIGGTLHNWVYDGLSGTTQTIIPDGTGDVLYGCRINVVLRDSAGNFTSGVLSIANGATVNITVGANTVAFGVLANGSLIVDRSIGTDTIKINLEAIWL